MKKILNSITLFFFNRAIFPEQFIKPDRPDNFNFKNLISRTIDEVSVDQRRWH